MVCGCEGYFPDLSSDLNFCRDVSIGLQLMSTLSQGAVFTDKNHMFRVLVDPKPLHFPLQVLHPRGINCDLNIVDEIDIR